MFASAIAEIFLDTCRTRGDERALLWLPNGTSISFRELHDQYDVILTALRRVRIGPGDCVVSVMGNQPAFFPLLVACLELGGALLPLGETTDAEATAIAHN